MAHSQRPLSSPSISSSDDHPTYTSTAPLLPTTITPMSEPLPPTTHRLAPRDRTLLIRSTRKLGQLLGATPHLVDLPDVPRLIRRSTVPAQHYHHHSHDHKQQEPYVLTPPTLRIPATRSRSRPVSSSSSSSSVPASPGGAGTPPDPATVRRQKMEKLKRTLGENVPPELVFRSTPTSPTKPSPVDAPSPKSPFSLWKKASFGVLGAVPPSKRARSEDPATTRNSGREGSRTHLPWRPTPSASSEYSRPSTPHIQRATNTRRSMKKLINGTPPDVRGDIKVDALMDHDRDPVYDLLSLSATSPDMTWPDEHQPPSPLTPSTNTPHPDPHRRAAKLARFFGVEHSGECMVSWDAEGKPDAVGETTPRPSCTTPRPKGTGTSRPLSLNGLIPSPAVSSAAVSSTLIRSPSETTGTPTSPIPIPSARPTISPFLTPVSTPTSSSLHLMPTREQQQHRRSASLNTLLTHVTHSSSSPNHRRSMTPPPSQLLHSSSYVKTQMSSLNGLVPPSPPPFADSWEFERDEGSDGGSGSGIARDGALVTSVHVQGGKLKRVVSVERGRMSEEEGGVSMQGVMNRLRELPGGR